MRKIDQILADLDKTISPRKKIRSNFPNFIYKIRFPVYKNLESHAEIKFKYPLTVLVGQNGCGKSSFLQALQGAPSDKSVGNFWFSTKLDPIKEGEGKPNCFIYEYFNHHAKKNVEIIKQRVRYRKKSNGSVKTNPDYWEPTRASLEYDMVRPKINNGVPEPGSNISERWKVPKINVEYIEFRSELSAFDQYFYFGEKPHALKRYSTKQDRLRFWVKSRLSLLLNGHQTYVLNRAKKKLNKPVEKLPDSEVDIISTILGKNYLECMIVEHKCFGTSASATTGYSVKFKIDGMVYTEAFAGSGEMSVVRVVHTVINSAKNSLILLDEPEVSLHPGAQKKLLNFLLEQCLENGHQIVVCSHSPVFLENLPEKAIRVFVPNNEGKFRIVDNVSKNDAFVQIGQTVHDKKQIIVEDIAAKLLVMKAISELGKTFVEAFQVDYYPGGETSIFKDMVVHSRENNPNIYVIFDGDIYIDEWPKDNAVASNDVDDTIEKYCGQNVKKLDFRLNTEAGAEEVKRSYLNYLSQRCFFLPTDTPEELIWEASTIQDKKTFEEGISTKNKNRYKEYLGQYVRDQVGNDTSSERTVLIKQILKKKFCSEDPNFKKLRQTIKKIATTKHDGIAY